MHHVYIDEAGVPRGRVAYLVVSAVIVEDSKQAAVRGELAALRATLSRKPRDMLHFANLRRHALRVRAARDLGGFSVGAVTSVVIASGH